MRTRYWTCEWNIRALWISLFPCNCILKCEGGGMEMVSVWVRSSPLLPHSSSSFNSIPPQFVSPLTSFLLSPFVFLLYLFISLGHSVRCNPFEYGIEIFFSLKLSNHPHSHYLFEVLFDFNFSSPLPTISLRAFNLPNLGHASNYFITSHLPSIIQFHPFILFLSSSSFVLYQSSSFISAFFSIFFPFVVSFPRPISNLIGSFLM